MTEFCRMLATDTGVSIVVDQTLDQVPVTVEISGQTVDDVLHVVARRAGVHVTKTGNLYYIGQIRREDRASLVRRVRRLSSEDVRAACSTLQSDLGAHAVFPGGLVVVGDRVEVLARINELLDRLEAADSPVWVVQFYLVSLSQTDMRDLGMDLTPALDVSLAFAAGSSAGPGAAIVPGVSASSSLTGGLDALLRVARRDEAASMVCERCFFLGDGDSGRMIRGERIPVPRKVVTDQGTVSTQGYDFIQTGVQMDVQLREVTEGSARISGSVSLSRVTGYVENAPVVINEEMDVTGTLASGGVYLIRAMEQRDQAKRWQTGLKLGQGTDDDTRYLQLWARIVRVGGGGVGSQEVDFPALAGSETDAPAGDGPELLPAVVEGDQ